MILVTNCSVNDISKSFPRLVSKYLRRLLHNKIQEDLDKLIFNTVPYHQCQTNRIYYQPSSPWTHPLSSSLLLRIIVHLYLRFSGFYQSIEYRLSLCRFPLHNWIVFVLIHRYIGSLKINCHVPLQWLEFLELICIARVLLSCKAEKGKRKNVSRR